MLVLSVADNGIGIPPDRLHVMFQPFTQADSSTTRQFGGTGLGLAICRQLAALMDGEINVRSVLGEGSVFTLSIPAVQATDIQSGNASPETSVGTADEAVSATLDDLPSLRILAADDNEINRLVLRTLLGQFGIEPVLVETGAEAVDAFGRPLGCGSDGYPDAGHGRDPGHAENPGA